MASRDLPVTEMDEQECWSLLAMYSLGRLATVLAGQPEIFPINYFAHQPTILLRTAEGTKLLAAVLNDQVAFEIDDHVVDRGWSVVAKGRARLLKTAAEIDAAERAPLRPWIATVKQHYVSISVFEVSGRHFVFGPEPDS